MIACLFMCFVKGFCKSLLIKQNLNRKKNCELQSIGQQIGIQLLCFIFIFCICLLFTAFSFFFSKHNTHHHVSVCLPYFLLFWYYVSIYAHMLLYYFLLYFRKRKLMILIWRVHCESELSHFWTLLILLLIFIIKGRYEGSNETHWNKHKIHIYIYI